MVDTNRLRGIIAEQGISQRQLAQLIGLSEGTFYRKMKKGVFNSNEIEAIASVLHIANPDEFAKCFFTHFVAY